MLYRLLAAISLLGVLLVSCGQTSVTESTPVTKSDSVTESTPAVASPSEDTVRNFLDAVKQSEEIDLQKFGCIEGSKPYGTETLMGIQDWQITGSELNTLEQDSLARYSETFADIDIAAVGTTMQGKYVFSVWLSDDYYQYLVRLTEGISNPQRELALLQQY